jgi:hypothetical protein
LCILFNQVSQLAQAAHEAVAIRLVAGSQQGNEIRCRPSVQRRLLRPITLGGDKSSGEVSKPRICSSADRLWILLGDGNK